MSATETIQPMYVRLPRDLHEELKHRAADEDRTMSQTIRVALRHYFATTSATPTPR